MDKSVRLIQQNNYKKEKGVNIKVIKSIVGSDIDKAAAIRF